jgi:hypothetical protein
LQPLWTFGSLPEIVDAKLARCAELGRIKTTGFALR